MKDAKKHTIREMISALNDAREQISARQKEILKHLPPKEKYRSCRNRGTHSGWVVPGVAAWTRAVKAAGMPYDHFWSGRYPTPSTQYPRAVAEFLETLTGRKRILSAGDAERTWRRWTGRPITG